MRTRWKVFIRIIGASILAVAGYSAGITLSPTPQLDSLRAAQGAAVVNFLLGISFALFGAALGYLTTPLLVRPLDAVFKELRELPPMRLTGAAIGMAIGLLLGALIAYPLSLLPVPFGTFFPVMAAAALAYVGAATVGSNPGTYLGVLRSIIGGEAKDEPGRVILVDTSVIIDGRITDVAETGFIDHTLLVPRFVLAELQQIADSSDTMRRNRGRRGLDVLNRLQNSERVTVEITDMDVPGTNEVDRKLVGLAKRLHCFVMTNDYNLNRVAEIEGVGVLNLNELANAVKTLLLPGERIEIDIIQEGKEFGQGVGYLEDGTMVVVENGREQIGSTHSVAVTRVLQTVAGRMVFAQLASDNGAEHGHGG